MTFCSKCGKEINDDAVICIHCGCSVDAKHKTPSVVSDSSSFGWGLLGFCVPIVGLILWLIWKNDTPLKAKSAGIGALVSVIASVILYIIYIIIVLGIVGASGGF